MTHDTGSAYMPSMPVGPTQSGGATRPAMPDLHGTAVRRRSLLALAAALAVATGAGRAPAQARQVLVFAAASLKTAFDAIAAKWRAEGRGQATISYAASSTLAKQIENGAPAELFISA